jgi:hypothetical protein
MPGLTDITAVPRQPAQRLFPTPFPNAFLGSGAAGAHEHTRRQLTLTPRTLVHPAPTDPPRHRTNRSLELRNAAYAELMPRSRELQREVRQPQTS